MPFWLQNKLKSHSVIDEIDNLSENQFQQGESLVDQEQRILHEVDNMDILRRDGEYKLTSSVKKL